MVLLAFCKNVIKQVCKEVFLVCFRAMWAKLTWQPKCVTETLKYFFINWKPCKSMSACWLLGSKLSGDNVHIPCYFIPHHIYIKKELSWAGKNIFLRPHSNQLTHVAWQPSPLMSCWFPCLSSTPHGKKPTRWTNTPDCIGENAMLSSILDHLCRSPPHPSTSLFSCIASLQSRMCTPHPWWIKDDCYSL